MTDLHKNFAYSTVATAPSPATSGTSLVVAASGGALFPTPPFNAVVWPVSVQPLASNAEVVRVTGISTDTFTITRTQESSSARTVVVGDQIMAAITNKTLVDAEKTTVLSYVTFTGTVTISNGSGSPDTIVTAAAITADGTTEYCVECFVPTITPGAAAVILLELFAGSTSLGVIGYYAAVRDAACTRIYVTPSAGSVTYSLRGWQASGAGSVQGGAGGSGTQMAGYIRVTVA